MDEQQKKEIIKKTKIKMWIGLVLIILVGLAITVYFVFLNPIERQGELTDVDKVNSSANINGDINANSNTNVTTDSGLSEDVQIQIQKYANQTCESDEECGMFPCNNNACLIKKCTCSCHCPESMCGSDDSVAPGYCLSN